MQQQNKLLSDTKKLGFANKLLLWIGQYIVAFLKQHCGMNYKKK